MSLGNTEISRMRPSAFKAQGSLPGKPASNKGASNPFEMLQAKRAHVAVIGRKKSTSTHNISKSRASQSSERRERLESDLASKKRTSQFIDKRIGEKIAGLSEEQKSIMRFAKERKMRSQKKSAFALNPEESEGLTHYGRSIDDIDKSELRGALPEDEDDDFDQSGLPSSAYSEVIQKSKDAKRERQLEKEKHEKDLEDLDAAFTSFQGKLDFRRSAVQSIPDEYDLLTKTLADDKKTVPGARIKSAAELEYENFKKIETLEIQRKKRQTGDVSSDDQDDDEGDEEDNQEDEVDDEEDNQDDDEDDDDEDDQDDDEEDDDDEEVDEEEEDNDSVCEESAMSAGDPVTSESVESSISEFGSMVEFLVSGRMGKCKALLPALIEKASADPVDAENFFSSKLLDAYGEQPQGDIRALNLLRIASLVFPVTDFHHRILGPALLLLSHWSCRDDAGIFHLALLFSFLAPARKFLPVFIRLASKLIESEEAKTLLDSYLALFPPEGMDGVLREYLAGYKADDRVFAPLRLHAFRPMEVPSMEPVFFESAKARMDPEMAQKLRLKKEYAAERRATKRHITRDANMAQTIAAEKRRKFDDKMDQNTKRVKRILDQSQEEIRIMSSTNRKREMKKNKKPRRMAGNKVEK